MDVMREIYFGNLQHLAGTTLIRLHLLTRERLRLGCYYQSRGKEQTMSKEEALRYWEWIYENIKDYFDPHWEGSERREHREHVQAVEWAIKALKGADDGDQ